MKKVYLYLVGIFIVLALVIGYISTIEPVRVALVGDFEGDRKDFSTSAVLSAKLAEKYINGNKGIKGKKLYVQIKNTDFSDLQSLCVELKKDKIDCIVTTANSEILYKLQPFLSKYKISCVASSSTATVLSNKQDYVYRVLPDDGKEVEALISYLERNNIKKKFTIISDKNNSQYKKSVEKEILSKKGEIISSEYWDGDILLYEPKNLDLINKSNVILILASSSDTGIIVQKLRKFQVKPSLYGLSWSADYNLIGYGGQAVENFILVSPMEFNSTNIEYKKYISELSKYSKQDGIVAYGVYQALMVIKNAYEQKLQQHITIKEALDNYIMFESLGRNIEFNQYGDIKDGHFILRIVKGKFIKLEER